MAPHWKLTVDGFGKIEHAEVDVRPLTLFVGPNNSGKSYLASLIWGIVAMHATLEIPQGSELQAVDACLRDLMARGWESPISPHELDIFQKAFQGALTSERNRVVSWIFRNPRIEAKQLEFVATKEQFPEKLPRAIVMLIENLMKSSNGFERTRRLLTSYFGAARLGRSKPFYDDSWSALDPVYMPASRTGFMQLYKAAARRSFRDSFDSPYARENWLEISTPAFHFIDMLNFGLGGLADGLYLEESNLLQERIGGRVEVTRGVGVNDYRYFPAGTTSVLPDGLPMGLSSSLVSELAPVILVLRHQSNFPLFVYEEPEAHLHPDLQRIIAQVIVRLVQKGVIVVITTHSADFCQQINNFMKLGALSPDKRAEAQKKFGYESQDYLELDDVSGYEFKLDSTGEHTDVIPMKKTPAGLVMPTFNKSLSNLTDEVFALQDLLAEQDDAS